jgi:hypothetical protein
MAKIKKQFNDIIMEKYPSLFNSDNAYSYEYPKGWEYIVDTLCAGIVKYQTRTTLTKFNKSLFIRIHYFIYNACYKIFRNILNILGGDPYKKYRSASQNFFTITSEIKFEIENKLRYKFTKKVKRLLDNILFKFFPKDAWVSCKPDTVSIAQIKEKFGTLRFYYDGGDDHVEGMVDYAEYLSSITCEVTGKPGQLCIKNGCYKTLSASKAKELGFEII